jgi:hypothetical protein
MILVIASVAKQSRHTARDCFVTAFLAMTSSKANAGIHSFVTPAEAGVQSKMSGFAATN